MEAQIQVRRSTAAQWISANPILTSGEPGLETDTGKGKYGDGVTHWNTLQYSWQHLGGGPTGPAGGSLAGTYPNPTLALNTVGAAADHRRRCGGGRTRRQRGHHRQDRRRCSHRTQVGRRLRHRRQVGTWRDRLRPDRGRLDRDR